MLAELERPPERKDTKLLTYGGAYRCLQLPVHLLSCDSTGAVQLQIMAVPDYRKKLTQAARSRGFPQIAMAALEGQAEQVLFPRCRDNDLARVFVLTPEAISAVTGRSPVPYVPPRTQFLTAKGEVADAPLIQANRKT